MYLKDFLKSSLKKNPLSFSSIYDNILIILIIIHAIISNTIFDFTQITIEIVLVFFLLITLIKEKLKKEEYFLIFIFIFVQAGSFFVNPFSVFLLNFKQFLFAILCVMKFKRKSQNSFWIHGVFAINFFLIFFQFVTKTYPVQLNELINTTDTRPFGILLNPHGSAFFMAVYLLGITLIRRFFFVDYLILFLPQIMTTFVSYYAQKCIRFVSYFFPKLKELRLQFLCIILIIFLIILFDTYLVSLIKMINHARSISGLIIFRQLADPNTYLMSLDIFPRDVIFHTQKFLWTFPELKNMKIGNEIAFISILVQGGILLSPLYLFYLFRATPHFVLFILVSMIHYSFPLLPLNIYTMCMFEKMYQDLQKS